MKTKEIIVGGIYHDLKLGIREVVSIDPATEKVTYRILAAKVEQEFDWRQAKMIPTIGTTAECILTSFAQWAKVAIPPEGKEEAIADLKAKKLKLTAAEQQVMATIISDFKDDLAAELTLATKIGFTAKEARSMRGIEKKGLVTITAAPGAKDGVFQLTQLGLSWIKAQMAA